VKPTIADLLKSGMTLKEASRRHGVTRERIRQVAKDLMAQKLIQQPKDYRPRRN